MNEESKYLIEGPKPVGLFRVLALGDVVGRAGRRCLDLILPQLKRDYQPDLILVNGENAAGGFGLTEKICQQFFGGFQIDIVTTGNHWHDKPEIHQFHKKYDKLLLPANMYNVEDSKDGYVSFRMGDVDCLAINLTGRVFMKGENRCPFKAFDEIYESEGGKDRVVIVDLHGEATSEKQAFAHYVTGRASLVFGTHTHCPTGDERILDEYTGYLTDLGMTGAYQSVIGMTVESSLPAFLELPRKRFEPAKKDPWLCGLLADIEPGSGAAQRVMRVRKELSSIQRI